MKRSGGVGCSRGKCGSNQLVTPQPRHNQHPRNNQFSGCGKVVIKVSETQIFSSKTTHNPTIIKPT